MSNNEISSSVVSPNNNNGSLDQLQTRSPPQQYYPNTVQSTSPSAPTQVHMNTAQMVSPHVDERAVHNHNSSLLHRAKKKKWFNKMRGSIMVVAVLVASVTYTSGLNPPGGFWQDDFGNHKAGSAILRDKLPRRYTTFFYANATAFMASLVIIILAMNEKIYRDRSKVIVLYIFMVLDLVSLMIAYAAGCARSLITSIYVIVLAVAVLLFVVYSAYIVPFICSFIKKCCPGMPDVGHDLVIAQDSVPDTGRLDMNRSSSI